MSPAESVRVAQPGRANRSGRRFKSQPGQRPTGRYDLSATPTGPHIQVGGSAELGSRRCERGAPAEDRGPGLLAARRGRGSCIEVSCLSCAVPPETRSTGRPRSREAATLRRVREPFATKDPSSNTAPNPSIPPDTLLTGSASSHGQNAWLTQRHSPTSGGLSGGRANPLRLTAPVDPG